MRVAEVDSWECENRDGKREDSIKEEVNRWREGRQGICEESVEGSTQPIEAYGEGEGQGAVACRETSYAEDKADCIEPADAAPCYQTNQKYLQCNTWISLTQ